ncbi:oligopeptide/dipeptide ABC transporter ATP-binding protein [Rhizobium ruizarguesonis]
MSFDHEVGLRINGLNVRYPGAPNGRFTVWDVSLKIEPGTIVGLAGESGCGKSTTAKAAIGFSQSNEEVTGASKLGNVDILDLDPIERRALWGNRVSYVSQSASLALNPALTVGYQLAQPLQKHLGLKGSALRAKQVELFELLQIANPQEALARYPFQFSGGQLQRVALAIALCCDPDVLILDEPTTGLDVTTQARISAMLRRIVDDRRIAVLYVSHDLALLGNLSDRIAIMYAGQIIEEGPTAEIVRSPSHPYTKTLLKLSPRLDDPRLATGIPGIPPPGVITAHCAFSHRCQYAEARCRVTPPVVDQVHNDHFVRCLRADELRNVTPTPLAMTKTGAVGTTPLLIVDQLELTYRGAARKSVDRVSFKLREGERLGIVGESGSGKSSILKIISGLIEPSDGYMGFGNDRLEGLAIKRPKRLCREIQLIFQNPDASLNPRHTIREILSKPLKAFFHGMSTAERNSAILEGLERVRLPRSVVDRLPSDLSGGQRQRIAIARAFLARPRLLLCDEVTSALDVSVQATVLHLISELSTEFGTSVIMVSHDLALVRTMADRTIVMRNGKVVEQADSITLFSDPQTEYTRELLAAIPQLHA